MNPSEKFSVETPGQRLDQFLAERMSQLSRGHVKKLIQQGVVKVNGEPADADLRLRAGDVVAATFADPLWAKPSGEFADWIIHEDPALLVLDKPAGLLMHPLGGSWLSTPEAALSEAEPNLAGLLLRHRPAIVRLKTPRCGIVHRLDRATSGVLLVAKTPAAYEALIRDFKERRISKTYRAVVRGAWKERRASVDAPVGRLPGHRRVIATPFGKEAQTAFVALERAPAGALVEARPLTGRTHQIRVHLSLLGHPVMGDVEFDRPRPGEPVPPRLMLHAYHVELAHPAAGRPAAFTARVPKDMREFWALCRK
ncbi:MAG TPA: RluA family pseudouridine synthase [Elusimicrobia bacterium]|nr:RluA family pseudouridine synthase [Elusimicrobiota bacterium]HBT61512.1 RluA family pseudouridine synthase [Elusimicrobiota bacterium]